MKHYIERSMTYDGYIELIDRLLEDGRSTGPVKSEEMYNYGKLNRQRMGRLEKTIELAPDVRQAISALNVRWIWLTITEGWCGDAAQNIPVIEKLAAANDSIETRYILRDENAELIDRFLTNGSRSIPKLIVLDAAHLNVLDSWGARPRKAQEIFEEMKRQGLAKPFIMESLQRWYNEDQGRSLQAEFTQLTADWAKMSGRSVQASA